MASPYLRYGDAQGFINTMSASELRDFVDDLVRRFG